MKATGEVMAIGTSFEQAMMKAVRGAEISQDTLNYNPSLKMPDRRGRSKTSRACTDERLFVRV